MLTGLVIPVGVPRLLNLPGRQLPAGGRNGGNLVSASLNGSRLVHIDMACVRAQHALMGAQRRRNYRKIGLGPADKEMDIQIRSAAQAGNQLPGLVAIGVLPVTGSLLHIRFRHSAENIRMGAFTVITVEKNHCLAEKRGDHIPRNL